MTEAQLMRRERSTLNSAVLTSGAEQVMDFVLPLFAGAVLGLSVLQTGVLLGVSQLIAFLVRPLAGIIVDHHDRAVIGALGSAGYALGCALYAMSTGLPLALIAAVVSGASGAFLWVAVRAIIGERLTEDSGVFAKLLSAEETGGWLVLVPAIILLSAAGYQWVFLALAICCLIAAGSLFALGGQRARAEAEGSFAGLGRKLRPMLLAVVVTMMAEAAIALLLILHLQRGFGLGVVEIAYVFLPGAIAMSILPPYLHRLVIRFGRRRMLMIGSLMSALFAAGLAFAPSPPWIAALWVLSAVAWSAVIPVQQAVIAEASGLARLGRGLSLYEAACLAGAFLGSLAAGVLYATGNWLVACLVCAAIIAAGSALIPAAVRMLGVVNHPVAVVVPEGAEEAGIPGASLGIAHWVDEAASGPAGEACESVEEEPGSAREVRGPGKVGFGRWVGAAAGSYGARAEAPLEPGASEPTPTPARSPRKLLTDFALHTVLIGIALTIAWAALPGFSFSAVSGIGPASVNLVDAVRTLIGGRVDLPDIILIGLRIWFVIYVIDVIWTAWKLVASRVRRG